MNKNYIFISAFVSVSLLMSFGWNTTNSLKKYHVTSLKDTSGAPAGRTGAPGESNCTSCHSGSVQSAAGINSVVISDGVGTVSEYIPGNVYTVTVSINSSSSKNGFEILALNGSNAQAGAVTITDATHTKVVTGSASKKYVTHTTSGTSLTTWSYNWTAPATNVGNVTFYLATNETNNLSNNSGDVIRLSQTVIGSTVGVNEQSAVSEVSVGYAENSNSLNVIVESKQVGTASVNIIDVNGKSVQFEELGSVSNGKNGYSVKLNNALPSGIYVAHIGVNNQFVSKKFYVN